MNGRRVTGAVAGALLAGLGLSALMMAGEKETGKPSELANLERRAAERLGRDVPAADQLPDVGEQTLTQGGHLLLSAIAGAAYAAATDEEAAIVPSGILFGLAFYGVAHWLAGPLLGVKEPEWRSGGKTIAAHAINHIAFGLATAAGAGIASTSRSSRS